MTLSPENVDGEFDRDHIRETHEIMYVVKRLAYEFCFVVPRQQANRMGKERPLLYIRFKEQGQMRDLILEVSQMEDFFEGLSRLMDYVRAEGSKWQAQF